MCSTARAELCSPLLTARADTFTPTKDSLVHRLDRGEARRSCIEYTASKRELVRSIFPLLGGAFFLFASKSSPTGDRSRPRASAWMDFNIYDSTTADVCLLPSLQHQCLNDGLGVSGASRAAAL